MFDWCWKSYYRLGHKRGKKGPWMCRWVWMMEIQRVGIKVEDQRDRVRGQDEWEHGGKTAPFVCSWLLKRTWMLQSELQRRKSDYPSHSLVSEHTHSLTHTLSFSWSLDGVKLHSGQGEAPHANTGASVWTGDAFTDSLYSNIVHAAVFFPVAVRYNLLPSIWSETFLTSGVC